MKNESYSFHELFIMEDVQKLQDAFSTATGLASIITEPDGTPITRPSGFTCLCNQIIRNTSEGLKNCMISDATIGRPCKHGPIVQKCLSAGLVDGGASIMIGDHHIANWMMGQVMDISCSEEDILRYADQIGADRSEVLEALKDIPKMSLEQFNHIAEYLYMSAKELSNLAVLNLQQKQELKMRLEAQAQLMAERELFSVTIQSIGDGVITTDLNGLIKTLNGSAEKMTGWSQAEAYGVPFDHVFQIMDISTKQKVESPVSKALSAGMETLLENAILLSKDHTELIIAENTTPIRDANGNIYGAVSVFRDTTEEKRHAAEMEYLVYHDHLTDLYNRTFYDHAVPMWLTLEHHPISVVMGDVNGLKLTNDLLGHVEGDKLLKVVSSSIQAACRQNDLKIRWGGDEFLILMPNTSYEQAALICDQIKKICAHHTCELFVPSIALGIDTKTEVSQSLETTIKKAEDRMYRNKLLETKSKKSGTVASLQRTLLEKSFETEEHALRLIDLSQRIGQELNFNESELDDLKLYAILHDIGKVAISDTILTKPGRLTPAEWNEMKKHSEIGFRIAQSAMEISHIAEYILNHHEWWNGSGYPQGRSGEEIPLFSRIMTVVDAYDAMISNRPYKTATSKESAITELNKFSGVQFDPAIVTLFSRIMA